MLLMQINLIPNDEIQLTGKHHLFGTDDEAELWLQNVSNVIKTLIDSNGLLLIVLEMLMPTLSTKSS